jgi:hypothetical protein
MSRAGTIRQTTGSQNRGEKISAVFARRPKRNVKIYL